MKCKDCSSMCKYRSSDSERECFYSQLQLETLFTEPKTYNQVNEEKHWQDVRERAAIAAMQGLLANSWSGNSYDYATAAVILADELVKRLKRE